MGYREYTAIILDRGVYFDACGPGRIHPSFPFSSTMHSRWWGMVVRIPIDFLDDMMSASLAIVAFVLMFLPVFALDFLEKRRRTAMLRVVAGIGLASAAYCIASGIAALSGWHDALGAAGMAHGHDPATLPARAIRHWPYGAIAIGALWMVVYAACLGLAPRPRSAG